MTPRRTNVGARKAGGKARLFLVLVVIALTTGAVSWVFLENQDSKTSDTVLVSELFPAQAAAPSPTNRPVKIQAEIPQQLTDEQRFGLWVVAQVLDDPNRWVGKPLVEMSENDRQVFTALILTESSFQQFAQDGTTLDSGIDCDGLAQLCNDEAVCDPSVRWNPFENTYCGAVYFKELVEKWNGNYATAVAEYKGALDTLPNGQTVPNPKHEVVELLFDYLSLQ